VGRASLPVQSRLESGSKGIRLKNEQNRPRGKSSVLLTMQALTRESHTLPEACPEGTVELSPGFQPWEHAQSYGTALNRRQIWIERKHGLRPMNAASESHPPLRPFMARRLVGCGSPRLKPWASCSPFGAERPTTLNMYSGGRITTKLKSISTVHLNWNYKLPKTEN
jgi:hypothetical protein